MITYVDSSVLLRIVLGEKGALKQWSKITTAISSEVIRLECLRTLDRARIRLGIADGEIAKRRADVLHRLDAFRLIRLDERVLERAAQPLPTVVGSLDAIHLTSAIMAQSIVPDFVFATHDGQLAMAARASGFAVIGA
jgi:predicted nucleic acid-binding protein